MVDHEVLLCYQIHTIDSMADIKDCKDYMKINSVKSPTEFILSIERLIQEKNVECLEALMIYADSNGIELETVASLVRNNDLIKARLADECEALNLIKPTNKLAI